MKLPKIEWPTAIVLVAVIAAIVAVWITAPDHRGDILAALGTAGAVVLALMRALGGTPPPPPPAAPTSGGPSAHDDDSDDTQPPTSDGPPTTPTRPRRVTMPHAARSIMAGALLRARWLIASTGLVLALTGCGAGALRTHQTIATIARVSVVAAYPAIQTACEARMHQCTDSACLEGVRRDCDTAVIARGVAHEAVESYVDTIKIAAHAEEGRVGPALDTALTMLARAYETARDTIARTTGYQLPELPPEALAILRALASGVASMTEGAS